MRIILILLLLCFPCYAAEVITSYDEKSLPTLNDTLESLDRATKSLESSGLARFETPTNDGVPVGDGTNFDTKVLPSCSAAGQALQYNSSTNVFSCAAFGTEVITSTTPGNWTAPAGVTRVYVSMVGGGGAGHGVDGGNGGGGGGGAAIINFPLTVVPGNTYAYAVGAGGVFAYNQTIPGGDTTFSTLTVKGGSGGTNGAGGAGGNGGGGGGGNAAATIGGGYGGFNGGAGGAASGGVGGGGGGSLFGSGTNGAAVPSGTSSAAANSGAGAGGIAGGAINGNGGNGGSGIIIIMY